MYFAGWHQSVLLVPLQHSSPGDPKLQPQLTPERESPQELQNLQGLLTFTSPPVALSSALQTSPKPLGIKQQQRKEKLFRS